MGRIRRSVAAAAHSRRRSAAATGGNCLRRGSLQLFTNRYKGGVDTYLQVINAQTIALANERNNVDILRRRMDASVLLIKALGGSWNVSELPREASLR